MSGNSSRYRVGGSIYHRPICRCLHMQCRSSAKPDPVISEICHEQEKYSCIYEALLLKLSGRDMMRLGCHLNLQRLSTSFRISRKAIRMSTAASKECWDNDKLPPPATATYTPKGSWKPLGSFNTCKYELSLTFTAFPNCSHRWLLTYVEQM